MRTAAATGTTLRCCCRFVVVVACPFLVVVAEKKYLKYGSGEKENQSFDYKVGIKVNGLEKQQQ